MAPPRRQRGPACSGRPAWHGPARLALLCSPRAWAPRQRARPHARPRASATSSSRQTPLLPAPPTAVRSPTLPTTSASCCACGPATTGRAPWAAAWWCSRWAAARCGWPPTQSPTHSHSTMWRGMPPTRKLYSQVRPNMQACLPACLPAVLPCPAAAVRGWQVLGPGVPRGGSQLHALARLRPVLQ